MSEKIVSDYNGYDYKKEFWENVDREYEDQADRMAIRKLLPKRMAKFADIGGGYGRLANEYLKRAHKVIISALTTGSHTLHDGLNTFKTSGIDRLVTFANHDLATLTNNLRLSINSAKSYHHYQDPSATSVKFLFKTPSIK